MLDQYYKAAAQRAALQVPPLPLTEEQTRDVTLALTAGSTEAAELLTLLGERVEPGVSKAAAIKAKFFISVSDIEKITARSVTGFSLPIKPS